MKRLLAVPAALLFGASSLLSAASSVPANHPNPATDAAITVPPAAIAQATRIGKDWV